MILLSICLNYDDPNRNVLTNCYTQNTDIELDRNRMLFILHLKTTNNELCNVFPLGIGANLTLGSSLFPHIITVNVDNFNYKTTAEIYFPITISAADLDLFTTEQFAVIQLYTYAEITEIEILQFSETMSNLENCFEQLDVFLNEQYLIFSVTPSGVCSEQMVGIATNADSYIKQVYLNIEGAQIEIDLAAFIAANTGSTKVDIRLDISSVGDDLNLILIDLMQQPYFTSTSVEVISNQGGQEAQLSYPLENIVIDSISGFFESAQVMMDFESFYLLFDTSSAKVAQLLATLTTYTHVSYRFVGQSGIHQVVIQETRNAPFDETFRFMDLPCTDGNLYDADCTAFSELTKSNSSGSQFYFDIRFFNKKEFLTIQKTKLTLQPFCFSSGAFQIKKDSVCVHTVNVNSSACAQFFETVSGVEGTVSVQIMNVSGKVNDGIIFNKSQVLSQNQTSFCIQCTDLGTNCSKAMNVQQGQQVAKLTLHANGVYVSFIADMIVKANYSVMTIVTLSISVTIVVVSSVISILHLVHTHKMIKTLKKRKTK
ncbi:Conserved_hypothetical protein [Hexamita inflata]|uniref:Transmembrane protein n=1 Tax=Hexamita inflata TaxID=28002 RepID=A0AA86TMD1_9EUKA|nr:Conserved hypothetical protein [Hexamita inflata]